VGRRNGRRELAAVALAAGVSALGCQSARPPTRPSHVPARPAARAGTPQLPRCARPLGTVTFSAPDRAAEASLRDLGLASPVDLLRLLVAQSNCFAEKGSRPVRPPEYVLAPTVAAPDGAADGGGLRIQEARSTLVLGDALSGATVGSAEGVARVQDLGGAGALGGFGGGVAGLGGIRGYGDTPEGKLVAASLVDAYARLVELLQATAPGGGRGAPR